MNFILSSALMLLIRYFSNLNTYEIDEVKTYIKSLEHKTIDNVVKHARAAAFIKDMSSNLSDTAVDWVIKSILLWSRAGASK